MPAPYKTLFIFTFVSVRLNLRMASRSICPSVTGWQSVQCWPNTNMIWQMAYCIHTRILFNYEGSYHILSVSYSYSADVYGLVMFWLWLWLFGLALASENLKPSHGQIFGFGLALAWLGLGQGFWQGTSHRRLATYGSARSCQNLIRYLEFSIEKQLS